MQNKQSISPQVEGLFDKVRQQAEQYTEAFRLIEKSMRDMERQRHNLEYLIKELTSEVAQSIKENKSHTNENIKKLKEKTNETLGLYSEIDKVRDLREVLENLYENVKSHAEEIERTIPQFKRKAEKELYTTLVSVKDRIENELAGESDRIEEKITTKLRTLEGKFIGYEKRLKAITEHQIEELNRRHINISELNDKIQEMKDLTRKINKMIVDQIDQLNAEVEIKINEIHEKIDKVNEFEAEFPAPKKGKPVHEKTDTKPQPFEMPQPKEYDDDIDYLRQELTKIKDLSSTNENKSNIGLWLSGVAFAGIILLIVLLIL